MGRAAGLAEREELERGVEKAGGLVVEGLGVVATEVEGVAVG